MLLLIVLGILVYFVALTVVLAFIAGAATVNQRWDASNHAWFHSERNRKSAA